MAPKPDEFSSPKEVGDDNFGERVVISGIAGLYPSSPHIKKFSDILYNKINPINDENPRWKYDHPEVAQYTGKVPGLALFDAQFFKVHYRMGNNMDPMSRKILEQSYHAIYDAGISPEELSGKKVGVYIGSCFSETEKACFYDTTSKTGFGIAGCSKTMFANRISYWLNAKGPSLSIDDMCCSSTTALEQALQAIKRGECEAAIVGGVNLSLHPQPSVHYGRIIKLSMNGETRSFDTNASGCARSEAVNVIFLQKAKHALRIYAEVVHVKCEFTSLLEGELGPNYGFCRDPLHLSSFLEQFYKEARVSPSEVEYVEAFGAAVPESDKIELEAIDNVFCKSRRDPLLVGSVMSNIGYTEAASGVSAITKILLGYQKGELAANLNCDSPRKDVAGIRDGRIQIVTDHQKFGRSYTAVNGLSVTGLNSHVLLYGHYKPKDPSRYKSNIPYLVTISARQESSVENIIAQLKSNPVDPEEISLLHNIHKNRISGHLGRGFAILDRDENNETVCLTSKASYFDDAKRPLWFVYSGMGSQWAGMGTQLMRIPIFAAAIERCHRVLEPKGIDIVQIITSPDKTTFDNILNSFVGIAAVQIGLTDILRELGIVPDKIIGHSVGELGCAYADGCFTAEEMILAAYSRGLVSVQTPFIRGSMAAVGIGYQQVSKMCPPEIEVACHNGPDSSTISGPAEIMKEFVAELTKNDIFAKEVPCSNIAYHSRYIAEAGPGLLKYLKEVIPNPKLRSERWVSTSVPQDKWDEPEAKYSSAEYHTNNLLNSVLFEETSKLIPSNAVVVEIAPHGLLQAILKRSLSESCKHIPLTRRGHPDNAKFLLEAIGNLYMEGYNPTVQALYPQVEFPVSTETPHLSHLVEWAHQERWSVPLYVAAHRRTSALYKPVLSTYDDEHSFLKGHIIGDKNIYPISGILISVWDTLAMLLNVGKKQLSVEFKDVYIHSLIIICNDKPVKFNISIQRGTGRFEVNNEGITIASGYIKSEISPVNIPGEQSKDGIINSNDIYQLLHAKGYNYQNKFRSIQNIDQSLTEGQIIWTHNWITFIDALIQMNLLRRSGDTLSYPNYIKRITIDINHLNKNSSSFANAQLSEVFNSTSCGGVVIEHMQYEDVPQNNKIALNALTFIPHYTTDTIDEETALYSLLQMVAENLNEDVVNILEVSEHSESVSKIEKFIKIADTITGLKIDFSTIQRCTMMDESNRFETNIGLLLVNNLSSDDSMCQKLDQILKHNAFIINKEIDVEKISAQRPSAMYQIISAHTFGNMRLELSIWRPTNASSSTSAFSVMSTSDLPSLVSSIPILPPRQRIIILTPYPPVSGLTNLIKEWRTRDNRDINLVIVNHKIHEEQNLDQMSFTNLAVNILDQGVWGGEYFLPIKNETVKGVEKALEIKHLGDLDSLHWVKVPEPSNPGIPIKIHYAGINKSEVKTKLDKQSCKQGSSQSRLLFDFSGKTDSGVSVMGVAQEESLKTRVKTNLELLWPVPKHWNLEDAATVPLAYTIAFYCLCIKSRLYRGNSILVNGGAGALGQAIISIALHLGCEVFTTVSDTSKKQFLLKLFPELKEENITNSRDNCFSDVILDNTKGLGCNMVITCCKGVHKMEAIKCCAMSGVVIDTSLITDHEDFQFGMKNLVKSLSYHSISISSLFEDRNIEELKRIQHMISEGIAQGYVRPLTRVTFPLSEVSRAYHFHTSNRNRGRILLNMQEDVQCLQTKIYCKPDLYHLLVSADQILGIEFAERLVNRGARKLILYFTSQSSCLQFKLRSWEKQGVEIKICDAKEFNNITDNIKIVQNLEGIYFIDVSDADVEKINKQVEHINLRSQLRYFAEIRTRIESFGTTGALSTPTKVPKTRVILPLKDAKVESPLTIRDAVNAVELALCSKHRVVLGQISNEEPPASLIKDINLIANIEIPNDINGKATLGNLGMSHFKCEAVKNLLLKDYNTSIDEENILSLTIDSLRDIARKHKKIEVQSSIGGLSTFFSTVDPDELLATTEMVFLQTLSGSSALGMDEFDVNQSFLCVIPGVEGHHERFRSICERLKLPALVLQPPMHKMESDQEMAARFADILLTKTRLTDRFYLLGYERGVMVALEMAAILESKGLTGTVFCLGGTPEEVQRKFEEELGYLNTTESLQKEVLQYMGSLISSVALEVLNPILVKNLTWDEKLNSFVQQLLSSMSLSTQYAKEIILSAYNGINQVRNYKSDLKPLRSSIIYVRPQDVTPKTNTKVYSEKPTIDYTLKSPLKYACNDLLCSAIINRHLDEDVLNKFETESLLETYIADSVSFMTNDKLLTSPCD